MLFEIIYITFIILTITLILIALYFYKKGSKKQTTQIDQNFDLFLKDVKEYMQKFHPKININYSIIERTKNEKREKLREVIVVENIVEQFCKYPYKKTTQKPIPREYIWIGYEKNSLPSLKLPMDWQQRKEFIFKRDNKSCNRCGFFISNLNSAHIDFVNDIKNGGGYNFENLLTLCTDCHRVLNSSDYEHTLHILSLNEKLLDFIKN